MGAVLMGKKPVMLLILDGFGIGKAYEGNAVSLAKTPNIDRLSKENPTTTLDASGLAVGLPAGQMGNSEVGHLNIGSGRVIYQDLTKITKEIEEGDFFNKNEFFEAMENVKNKKSKMHLMGLVSDGGVHSHNTHLYGLLKLMKMYDVKDVYIHVILDGRDVPPNIGKQHIEELQQKIAEIGVGEIATVSGRYYAMDRDKRWERTQLYYDALTLGKGIEAEDPVKAVEKSYEKDVLDEFVLPTVIEKDGEPVALVETGDSVIFFNFRPDRARQITRAIVDPEFHGFVRTEQVDTHYVAMTEYDKTIPNVHVVYKNDEISNTLGEYISSKGLTQLRGAETEKYAHVTFFFNGGRELQFPNEDRVLIPSPKVATYDLQPEMSAFELADEIINRINMDKYDLFIVNFANPDMVGHTGVIPAAIKAVETVDTCVGRIMEAFEAKGGKAIITSDHGNSEELVDTETGIPVTAHTTNKVPLILVGEKNAELREGKLADLAPTLLDLLDLEKPVEMTGSTLILSK